MSTTKVSELRQTTGQRRDIHAAYLTEQVSSVSAQENPMNRVIVPDVSGYQREQR